MFSEASVCSGGVCGMISLVPSGVGGGGGKLAKQSSFPEGPSLSASFVNLYNHQCFYSPDCLSRARLI